MTSPLGLAALFGAMIPMAFADGPIVLRDAAQHELRFERPPQRVVTLLPSLTETVCALGECARLVATDRYSNWPASVRRLPKAGGLDDAQIEFIVSLKPDVVILAHAGLVTERLRDLGMTAFDVETWTYDDRLMVMGRHGLVGHGTVREALEGDWLSQAFGTSIKIIPHAGAYVWQPRVRGPVDG
jgi:iron complex transport system substrate-binding protein